MAGSSPNYSPSCALCSRTRPTISSGSAPNPGSVAVNAMVPDTSSGSTSSPGTPGTVLGAGLMSGPGGGASDMGSVRGAESTRSIHPFFADRHLKRKRRARVDAPPNFTHRAKRTRCGIYKPTRSARSLAARKRQRGHSGRLGCSIEGYIHRAKRPRYSGTNPSLPVKRVDATRADNNQFSES